MDKFELIDSITVQVDAIVDMRGVEKCRTTLEIIGKLNALRGGLAEEDKERDARVEALERRLRETGAEDHGDGETIGGRVYKYGETAGGAG